MGILQMNARELTDRADQLSENGILKLIGRWGMTITLPMVSGSLLWLGNVLWDMKAEQARLSGQIALLAQQITQLSESKYTANDANRDAKAQIIEDNEQDRRIGALETKFERLQALQPLIQPR